MIITYELSFVFVIIFIYIALKRQKKLYTSGFIMDFLVLEISEVFRRFENNFFINYFSTDIVNTMIHIQIVVC